MSDPSVREFGAALRATNDCTEGWLAVPGQMLRLTVSNSEAGRGTRRIFLS